MNDLVTIKVRMKTRSQLKYLAGVTGNTLIDIADSLVEKEVGRQNKKMVSWDEVKKKLDKKLKSSK